MKISFLEMLRAKPPQNFAPVPKKLFVALELPRDPHGFDVGFQAFSICIVYYIGGDLGGRPGIRRRNRGGPEAALAQQTAFSERARNSEGV